MNTQKYHIAWWTVLWRLDSSILQNILSYLKMFNMHWRKNITVKDNKKKKKKRKKINIANFINGFTNIYAYIICEENESK